MKYQAVIFDLDGVICNTDHYHYLAWKRIADEMGVYFDENINNRLRGVGRMQSLDIILEAHDVPLSEKE
ncbi:MAG TPA: HAD hydrolase-like protein, partial [Syntrophomonas sp.]|nr:HAD hydrolase-like protein [Syntrophomonas sp.]